MNAWKKIFFRNPKNGDIGQRPEDQQVSKSPDHRLHYQELEGLAPIYHVFYDRYENGETPSQIQKRYRMSEIATTNILTTALRRFGFTGEASMSSQHPRFQPIPTPVANNPPSIAVDGYNGTAFASLRVGRKSQISFHRTLRIPEDGKAYPLPASLGTLPIHRVEDYAGKVPTDWLEEGGFFLPLYQREALFLQFEGDSNRPMILKVCVGEVNAVTGQPYSENLSAHKQDYVVIPSQKWLDGINNGNGTVRQFVAMPLGQGYTVEAQVTDEEKHGGFQLVVYDAVEGRFSDPQIPVSKKIDIVVAACKRRFELKLEGVSKRERIIINEVRQGCYTCHGIAYQIGFEENDVEEFYQRFRSDFFREVEVTADNLLKNDEDLWWVTKNSIASLKSLKLRENIDPLPQPEDDFRLLSSPSPSRTGGTALLSSPSQPKHPQEEMGIAAGGSLEQQIYPDTYGVDSWDQNQRRAIKIHIINSDSYEKITGLPAPDSPITADHYQKAGIPWFSSYDESAKTLGGAAPFKRIRGVDEIDQRRGIKPSEPGRSIELGSHQIQRIKTPTLEEAANDLRAKALNDVDSEKWKSAILKIDYLFDLGVTPTSNDYSLRSLCNYHIGRCIEGIVDADLALAKNATSHLALQCRARCRITLGDYLGGKEDGIVLATLLGSESTGYEIAAEASYLLEDFTEAAASAQKACEFDPQNLRASEIAALAESGPSL